MKKVLGFCLTNEFPIIWAQLIFALRSHEIVTTPGLYNPAAKSDDEVKRLIKELEKDRKRMPDVIANFPPRLLSSVLRRFLDKLPNPVVPFSIYQLLTAAAKCDDRTQRELRTREVLMQIPAPNKQMLLDLIDLLLYVLRFRASNRESPKSLAAFFGISILRPKHYNSNSLEEVPLVCEILHTFLTRAEYYFEGELDFEDCSDNKLESDGGSVEDFPNSTPQTPQRILPPTGTTPNHSRGASPTQMSSDVKQTVLHSDSQMPVVATVSAVYSTPSQTPMRVIDHGSGLRSIDVAHATPAATSHPHTAATQQPRHNGAAQKTQEEIARSEVAHRKVELIRRLTEARQHKREEQLASRRRLQSEASYHDASDANHQKKSTQPDFFSNFICCRAAGFFQ